MKISLSKSLIEKLNNEMITSKGNLVGDTNIDLNINRSYIKTNNPRTNPTPTTDDYIDNAQNYSDYEQNFSFCGICESFSKVGKNGGLETQNGDVIIPLEELPKVYEGGGFEKLVQLVKQVETIIKDNNDAKNSVLAYFDSLI